VWLNQGAPFSAEQEMERNVVQLLWKETFLLASFWEEEPKNPGTKKKNTDSSEE
jgi:hypothetical protein